ncbi:alpha/beta hydrolase [Collinsella intestinalis]|uniref:alpha/beta hydrolase n=1 Tax=Collinsella intestinalis TaxID=147207 RepID=UPI00195EF633|nr:alpha/beta hydrolase-fold protein [Collinsella intestinalis]MBM6682574.1 alpha/beta hydrolase [Collinsella intestinalis]
MGYVDATGCEVFAGKGQHGALGPEACALVASGPEAPVIYVIDSPEHPFDVAMAASGIRATVVRVPVRSWNDSLTPWPAAGLRPGAPDFGGHAAETLTELVKTTVPAVEAAHGLAPARRAICGYSLGGLFALYAFTRERSSFSACACLSGSVWYEDWVDYLRRACPDSMGRYAFLSIGKKERRAGAPIMRTVQDKLETCVAILRERGCEVDLVIGPGNHMQHHTERLAAGLAALDVHLT